MRIIGISCFYHDSAAALIENGKILSACQEERFTRIKHDASFPHYSIEYILKENNVRIKDIDYVIFYDKPLLKFERLIETFISEVPKGFASFKMAIPVWLKEKLFLKSFILKQLKHNNQNFDSKKLLFSEHHLSHLASAFYPSPFEKAVILTLDGVGEWATSSVAIGDGNKIDIIKEIHFPNSLGLLYSAFTYYTGFKVNSGEYKLMGLAPYGEPIYKDKILNNLVDVKGDGSFRLDQSYFNYVTGLTMISKKFEKLFGQKARDPLNEELTKFHMDIAASIQIVTEEIVLKITRELYNSYGIKNLCLAGGVALNCVANGKIIKEGLYDNVWVQPASGDAGGAVGAALVAWYREFNNKRYVSDIDEMQGSYLGPEYSDEHIQNELISEGAKFEKLEYEELISQTASEISKGKAIGWFQGKMEFGPRALGSRSILADPRDTNTQRNLNLKVKYRESFRPFAPAILNEKVDEWFKFTSSSPYMLMVAEIQDNKQIKMTNKEKQLFGIEQLNVPRSNIPAVTHVDYSARIQTVHKETNRKFYELIDKFFKITGCPILVNTSFNVRGAPIVCTPSDAFRCFMGTELDLLVIGNFLLRKEDQSTKLKLDYKNKYELD